LNLDIFLITYDRILPPHPPEGKFIVTARKKVGEDGEVWEVWEESPLSFMQLWVSPRPYLHHLPHTDHPPHPLPKYSLATNN